MADKQGQAGSRPRSPGQRRPVQRPYTPLPEFQAFLDVMKALGNDLDTMTRENIHGVRFTREQWTQRRLGEIPVESFRDFTIDAKEVAVPVRLYVPHDKQLARAGKLPMVIFFHGGGWTLGNIMLYDSITRYLARQIPALVLSVEYRLAPENPYPAAVQDADAVVQWVQTHHDELGADPDRIVVAGDSAGGTLATVSAIHALQAGGPRIAFQVLIYPSTDISSTSYASHAEYGTDYLLTLEAIRRFREFYLPDHSDWTNPDVSPLLAEDLSGLPPALLITAGCDPLRDEGEKYAQKLASQGVRVIYRLEPQLIHAFLSLFNLEPSCSPYAEAVLGYTAGVIRRELQAISSRP